MAGKQRFNAPQKIGARSFAGSNPQYGNPSGGGIGASIAYAPFDRRNYSYSIILLSYVAELLGTFVFAFVVNLAKASITGTMSSVETFLAGTFLGLIAGLSYYLAAGWNMDVPDANYAELPKHLSWSVSIAYFLVMRTGAVVLIGYLVSQTAGSAIAGGLLRFLGSGTIPTADAQHMGRTWFVEIIGVFMIIFPLLYKHLAGATLAEEDNRRRNAHLYAAGGRAIATAVLFQFQGYSFDPVIYLAGLIGSCNSGGNTGCPNASPFSGAVAFYVLVPLLGAVIASAFYALVLLFVNITTGFRTTRIKDRRTTQADSGMPTAAEQKTVGVQPPINSQLTARKTTTAGDLDKYN